MRGNEPDRLHLLWKHLNALNREDFPRTLGNLEHLYDRLVRLYSMYEYAPNGYVRLDQQGHILGCNQTFCTMVGGHRPELLDRSCFDLVNDGHRDRLSSHLSEAFGQGQPAHCELQLKSIGGPRWFRFDIDKDLIPEDRPTIRATVTDISDQKAKDDAIRLLAEIVEASEDAILRLNPDGIITAWNPAAERIYGYSRESAIGKPVGMLLPPGLEQEFSQLVDKLRSGRKIQSFETSRRHRNGTELNIVLTMSAISDEDGQMIAVSSIERNISSKFRREQQLREINEQLQMAAQAAKLGVWNYDPSTRTWMCNAQLYRLLGLEPRDGPQDGKLFSKFIHPADRTGAIANIQSALNGLEDEFNEEFRIIRMDGKTRWLEARGRIYRDARGHPMHVSGINYDITRRKKVEARVRLAQFQLSVQLAETERINEELSQYAYVVSHDLKAPLRALHNYAEFLYEDLADTLTGVQKSYLEGMKAAARQGNTLIDDLLSLSHIERMSKSAANVPDLVMEIRSNLSSATDVEFHVQPQWPDFSVDRILLKQILFNLIANGIKFNTRTPKRIDIGWQPAGNDFIEIIVADNGIGIDPQYWDQIFKIFQRLHTQRTFEGTGIGLAIVHKAAHKLGGSVRLMSEPEVGSTFFVKLPRG